MALLLCFLLAGIGTIYLPASDELVITSLPGPTVEGSAEANLWVDGKTLYLTWIESQAKNKGRIWVAAYEEGHWGVPHLIREANNLFINWADFPKLAVSGRLMVAGWPEKLDTGTYSYGLKLSRSMDRGASWSEPQWLHQDLSPAEHGFLSLAALPQDRLLAVWLDGRAMVEGVDGHGTGSMQLRSRVVSSTTLSEERLIDDATCECCGTALSVAGDRFLVAYRNRDEGEIRDIFLARGDETAWQPGTFAAGDQWAIHGCPVNGPAIDSVGSRVALSWFSGKTGGNALVALSQDGGVSFPLKASLGEDTLGRVDVRLLSENRLAVLWLEAKETYAIVQLAMFQVTQQELNLITRRELTRTQAGRHGGFPRMVVYGESLVIACENQTAKQVDLIQVHF